MISSTDREQGQLGSYIEEGQSQASLGLIHATHAPALRPCLDVCRLHLGLGTVTFTFLSPPAFSSLLPLTGTEWLLQ